MPRGHIESHLSLLDQELLSLHPRLGEQDRQCVEQWQLFARAVRFHLRSRGESLPLVALLGGTGTGKSTLLNQLLDTRLSAASYRRTFTSGPIAAVNKLSAIPEGWLGIERRMVTAAAGPVRGEPGTLFVALLDHPLTSRITLIDTPDLDGDQPAHHAQADQVFRWAQTAVFLVTPEKYQMTELAGYYRLACRYRLKTFFVMNKCEEAAVIEEFRDQLAERGFADARLFVIPRHDSPFEPSSGTALADLKQALLDLNIDQSASDEGLVNRCTDLIDRLSDRIITPLRGHRDQIDALLKSLQSLKTSAPGLDVSPLTRQLQRHMQEQSVLYLMGPGRVLERLRQMPVLIARLPRTIWNLVGRGERPTPALTSETVAASRSMPDFGQLLCEQLLIAQSRIDDLLRADDTVSDWLNTHGDDYHRTRIDPARAAQIAVEEIHALEAWLEEHRQRKPRDTRVIEKLLRYMPGGERISGWSEAAPYLLTLVVATHGAFFGPIDLLIIGGFSLSTWLGEKLSNEVAARVRQSNRRISERFEALAREQVELVLDWLDRQAPRSEELDRLEKLVDKVHADLRS
ncbi:MAG: hypothetical protein GXY44_02155 [Phycisphaerales bacterium]|nr:hypothetical protein [Phycisphaerales bacterium]